MGVFNRRFLCLWNMVYNPQIHHRHSIRLPEYNYRQPGYYFVTMSTQNRECLFGEIKEEKIILSEIGKIVYDFWPKVREHFNNVELDEFIVMPNHFHGIVVIKEILNYRGEDNSRRGNLYCRGGVTPPRRLLSSPRLGQIIAYFKYQTTKHINKLLRMPAKKIWQRNYYEHVIRNDQSLYNIRNYIVNNQLKWNKDVENLKSEDKNIKDYYGKIIDYE